MLRRAVDADYVHPLYDKLIALLGKNPNGNSWNRSGTNACVHAFVGKLAISVDKLATEQEDMDGERCESTVDMALCAVLSAVIAKA